MTKEPESYKKIRLMRCLVCKFYVVDVAHIKTKGSGGSDEIWNLMPLCRSHHTEQHKIGIQTFAQKHFAVANYFFDNGWYYYNGKLLNQRSSFPAGVEVVPLVN